jgi:predicted dehydrogenase
MCRIRWFYDLEPGRARKLAEQLGAGATAPDFETVVSDPEVQIISIASFDDAHFDQTVQSLRAGKHVFVEKPLCRSFEELRAIKQTWVATGGTRLVSNLVLRTAPLYVWLKQAVAQGEFGEVYAFDGDYLYGRLDKITKGWRKNVSNYSVMLGGGVHLVDLMFWITGQKPDSVTATGNRICTAGTGFRDHDFHAATFRFSSGMVGRITANFGCVHRHHHVVRIFGTKKTFIYDDQDPRVHSVREPGVSATKIDLPPLPASKGELIPGFVRGILDLDKTEAEAQYEFDVVSACVAADEAMTNDRKVEIPYV